MFRKHLRIGVLPIVCAMLFITACGPSDSTAQSCLRFDALRVDLEEYENHPSPNLDKRFETAEAIAAGFDDIRDNARDPELAEAADVLSELYWTVLDVYYDNMLLGPDQVIAEVVDQVGVERVKSANPTYERICGEL